MPLLVLLALVVAAFAAPLAKAVPSESPRATWVTDKAVKTTLKSGNTLYIGGEFEHVARRTGPAAAFDATTAELTSTPLISGSIGVEAEVVAPDGSGGYFAGGNFSHAQGEPRQGLVHVKADGSLDPNFGFEMRERIRAIQVVGNTVYVGGRLFEIDGEAREGLAAFNVETGELLPWAPQANNEVFAIAADGEYLYIGGKFTQVNGENRTRLASVKGVGAAGEGEVTSWNPVANGETMVLEISGSTLYAGGKFTQVGGVEHKYLASFNLSAGAAGEPELNPWAPLPSNYVTGIAASEDGETVYVGGEFIQMGGESHLHIAAVKASDGTPIEAWVAAANSKVWGLAVSGSTLYAAGEFSEADGQSRWAAAAFETEGTGGLLEWNPRLLSGAGHSIALTGSDVAVAGFFNGAEAITRNHIAAIDLTTGEPTEWAPEANQNVYALALSEEGTQVFVGGYFTQLGGEARERLAAVRAAGTGAGEGEVTSWSPKAANSVEAIAVDGSRVYVGGGFPTLEGKSAFRNLAAYDFTGETGILDETWKPSPNNNVYALAVSGGTVYAGGQFSEIGGQARKNLAALNATNGAASESWAPEPNSRVRAIALSGSNLFAGGLFETVGGASHKHVVEIDSEGNPTAWSGETDGEVYGVAVDGSTVYVGGSFNHTNGANWKNLAAFDIGSGELLSWYPGPRDMVNSLEYKDSTLVVGGSFWSFGTGPQRNIGVFSAPVLTVAASGEGSGTVTSAPTGIECGSTCSSGFGTGEEVTLTAEAAAGSEFAGWSGGGCSGTGTCVVIMNADAQVTATFTAASGPEGGGEGSGGGSGGGTGGGSGGTGGAAGSGGSASGGGSASSGGAWINTRIKRAKIKHTARGTAGFWFYAKGNAAKRFECSLVKKPARKNGHKVTKRPKVHFKRCGMHRRIYRHLKPGRYVFRVRAVGSTAWDHKPAKRKFRIR